MLWPKMDGYEVHFTDPLPQTGCKVGVISTGLPAEIYESYVASALTAYSANWLIQVRVDVDLCPAPIIEMILWRS